MCVCRRVGARNAVGGDSAHPSKKPGVLFLGSLGEVHSGIFGRAFFSDVDLSRQDPSRHHRIAAVRANRHTYPYGIAGVRFTEVRAHV